MGPLLNLGRVDAAQIADFLYGLFHRDFVVERTNFARKIWIDPQSHRLEDGTEQSFWHLTTRVQDYSKREGARYVTVKERLSDFKRSERLEWVKLIIDDHAGERVRSLYHRKNNAKKNIRLYL